MRDILDTGAAPCSATRAADPAALSRDLAGAWGAGLHLARPADRLSNWADLLAADAGARLLWRRTQRLLVAQDAMLGRGISRMAVRRFAGDRHRLKPAATTPSLLKQAERI